MLRACQEAGKREFNDIPVLYLVQDFDTVLNMSFSLMLIVYGTVAALGYYYFGSSAHTLLTTDLARNSPFTGHYLLLPGLTVDKLVSLSILLNAYSTYPSLVLVMQVAHLIHLSPMLVASLFCPQLDRHPLVRRSCVASFVFEKGSAAKVAWARFIVL